jgi:hypothetical protein
MRKIAPGDTIGISFESREKGDLFGTACFMKPQEYTLNFERYKIAKRQIHAMVKAPTIITALPG